MSTALVWFRRDLRLADNPAFSAALKLHARVLAVYIHAPDEEAPWQPGAASAWWLHHSLNALDADLRKRGARLYVCEGPSRAALRALIEKTGADAVYWNRVYEPALIGRDAAIKKSLHGEGIDARSFKASLLFDPWEIATGSDGPYKVFTPFWRNARAKLEPTPPLSAPRRIATVDAGDGVSIDALKLLPTIRWDTGFAKAWHPGEAGAMAALRRFRDRAVADYPDARNIPGEDGTSRLSPHLHFGEVSPMQVVWTLHEAATGSRSAKLRAGIDAFVREIGWREFSYHLMFHFPHSIGENLNPKFERFAWARRSGAAIERWQRGETGFPIVDAGMRELWTTGWMHNRVRMLVASFLTKNLRQHWLEGARWFWDTLVDADLANNTQGWQWTAGTGADASPYFRIFNPVTQGERFDPDGAYVRRWVPELAKFPGKTIHQPWNDADRFRASGYVERMLDLAETRESALAAYMSCK